MTTGTPTRGLFALVSPLRSTSAPRGRGSLALVATVAAALGLLFATAGDARPQGGGPATNAQLADCPPPPLPPVACISGFSKDLCDARLSGGQWGEIGCPNPSGQNDCLNLTGRQAILSGNLFSNSDLCNPNQAAGVCDEFSELAGPLVMSFDVNLKRDGACRAKGAWRAKLTLSDPVLPVVTLVARGGGTIGTGSHRPAICPAGGGPVVACGADCEPCGMAQFDPQTGTWSLHIEGLLRGRVQSGPHAGALVQVTIQGTFRAPGTADGPVPPDVTTVPWTFCGTLDGVALERCP